MQFFQHHPCHRSSPSLNGLFLMSLCGEWEGLFPNSAVINRYIHPVNNECLVSAFYECTTIAHIPWQCCVPVLWNGRWQHVNTFCPNSQTSIWPYFPLVIISRLLLPPWKFKHLCDIQIPLKRAFSCICLFYICLSRKCIFGALLCDL